MGEDIGSEGEVGRVVENLNELLTFYNAAAREPVFSCKYLDGDEEYTCDSILSDVVGVWITELTGMSREDIEGV